MCELQNSEYPLTESVYDEAVELPARGVEEMVSELGERLAPKTLFSISLPIPCFYVYRPHAEK